MLVSFIDFIFYISKKIYPLLTKIKKHSLLLILVQLKDSLKYILVPIYTLFIIFYFILTWYKIHFSVFFTRFEAFHHQPSLDLGVDHI